MQHQLSQLRRLSIGLIAITGNADSTLQHTTTEAMVYRTQKDALAAACIFLRSMNMAFLRGDSMPAVYDGLHEGVRPIG